MPKNEKAEALIQKLEQDPIQALRLAVATVLVAAIDTAMGDHRIDWPEAVDIALSQADQLIAKTIGA